MKLEGTTCRAAGAWWWLHVGGGIIDIAPGVKSKLARVWRLGVDGNQEETTTLELTAVASAAAVHGDGGQVGVGGADGVVRLFGGEDWAPSGELAEVDDGTTVLSLAYTPNGDQIVAGRRSGVFVVYHISSRVAIRRFADVGDGWVAAVAPHGDLVAVGGFDSKVMTLRELAPPAPLYRWTVPLGNSSASHTLVGAVAAGGVAALAVDSRLIVHDYEGVGPPLTMELGGTIGCYNPISNPIAMRQNGKHVVCVINVGRVITCRALPLGEEVFTLDRAGRLSGGLAGGVC
jgi:hypothetical protein